MKVGLALSGGGARGFAHVGVLKALIDNGVTFDVVAGTSAGSIVGGAFAAGMSIDKIRRMAERIGWTNVTRPSMSPLGALSNTPLAAFLKRELPIDRIEEMPTPYAAVAFDLMGSKEVIFREGDLSFAIAASCAVPGVFAPLKTSDGKLLVDGGITTPLPVNVVREMGAEIVIAVDILSSGSTYGGKPKTAAAMMMRSAMTVVRQLCKDQHVLADAVIVPQIAQYKPHSMGSRDELFALGEQAALEKLDQIKELISRGR